MTVKILYAYGAHKGGTKDYKLLFVSGPGGGRDLLVKNWGKIGSNGQIKIETPFKNARKHPFDAAMDERLSKGYDMQVYEMEAKTPADVESVNAQRLLAAVPGATLREVWPGADPTFYQKAIEIINDINANAKAKAEAEAAEERAALSQNPFFGMFG